MVICPDGRIVDSIQEVEDFWLKRLKEDRVYHWPIPPTGCSLQWMVYIGYKEQLISTVIKEKIGGVVSPRQSFRILDNI